MQTLGARNYRECNCDDMGACRSGRLTNPGKSYMTRVRRSDWRAAFSWIAASRARTLLVALLLTCAGFASVLGLLRWEAPFMRWSFAVICWAVAVFVVARSAWHKVWTAPSQVDDLSLSFEHRRQSVGTPRFTPEFKEEAVKQVTERGYSVSEVAARIGVSAHSLYKWVKSVSPDKGEQQTKDLLEAKSEILRLRAQMRRLEEERDLLKKAARYFAREPE